MQPVDFYLFRGLAREARHWGDFVPLLESQDYCNKVLCLDLPGTGKYRKLTSPLSIEENAEFLLTQIPEKAERPRVALAVSLGAMVVVELLQKQAKTFSLAFLMNTSFRNLSPLQHRLQLHAFKQFVNIAKAGGDLKQRELQVLKMVSCNKEKWPAVSQQWAEIAEEAPISLTNFSRQLIAAARYKIAKQPPLTRMVVLNSLGDQMVHPSCSKKLAKHWDLPLQSHNWAGHDICIDDPQWVVDKIKEHLG